MPGKEKIRMSALKKKKKLVFKLSRDKITDKIIL